MNIEEEEFRFWINRFRHVKQEISLVRLGAGVPEVWYEVNMCGEFSKEREPGTKRVRTVLIRTVSDNIKLRYNLRSAPRHAYSY